MIIKRLKLLSKLKLKRNKINLFLYLKGGQRCPPFIGTKYGAYYKKQYN